MNATGTYSVKSWDEKDYAQPAPGMKLTRSSVEYEIKGEIEGLASVEYLMFYSYYDASDPHRSVASYIGHIRFAGRLSGRSGSFVMGDDGSFSGGAARSTCRILEGSGTEELRGIRGKGKYFADKDGCRIELAYELE